MRALVIAALLGAAPLGSGCALVIDTSDYEPRAGAEAEHPQRRSCDSDADCDASESCLAFGGGECHQVCTIDTNPRDVHGVRSWRGL